MKTILITGASGFIGYHLAKRLVINPELRLILLDNNQRGRQDEYFKDLLANPQVKFYQIDLCDISALSQISEGVDEIYHLAAIVGVKHCMQNPDKVLRTNILSTFNIIEFAKLKKTKRILFSSTCETYASGFEYGIIPIPSPETVPLVIGDIQNPRWTYAGSKMVGEQILIFNSAGNYEYKIVRYHNVFGPRMGFAHVVPEIVKRVVSKEDPFKIYGADQTRSFCFVEDAVTQTILAMENAPSGIYNVGNGAEEVTIENLIKQIFAQLKYNPKIEIEKAPPGSVTRRCPDTSKLWKTTGFKPAYAFQAGLSETVTWYQSEVLNSRVWE